MPYFLQNPIVYITRNFERVLGFELGTQDYYIISNYSDFAKQLTKNYDNILFIKEKKQLDTWQLLQNEKITKFINKLKNPDVLVFKNTHQIERICAKNNWNLLNPSANLANKIEEKISQVEWLGSLKKYLPPTKNKLCKDVKFVKKQFILQFNRSHTGSGTILIESKKQLDKIQNKFPEREVRISKYIEGQTFTSNNIVAQNKILIGNISYQITGLKPFTNQKFATIGNDWGVMKKMLDEKQIKQFKKIVTEVGKKMRDDGWKGLFGIDIMLEQSTKKLYLIEINARQPASASYESQLQKMRDNKQGLKKPTIFEAHLKALLNLPVDELKKINNGAQIILRNNDQRSTINNQMTEKLEKENFNVIQYKNTKFGSDLLRIQSKTSIMKGHNEFNKVGNLIKNFLK